MKIVYPNQGRIASAAYHTVFEYAWENGHAVFFEQQMSTDFNEALMNIKEQNLQDIFSFGFQSMNPQHNLF